MPDMAKLNPDILINRPTSYPIHPLIHNRWSPRAMNGEAISHEELMALFEAARCAPSAQNNQPWRFIYAKRNTPHWTPLYNLLVASNQVWCKNAAVLMVVISSNLLYHNQKPAVTHSYDTGAAWMSLALEGSHRGLVVHGIGGFDSIQAKSVLLIPEGYTVEAMIAIGKPAPREVLPPELQEREKVSPRRPLETLIMEGVYRE